MKRLVLPLLAVLLLAGCATVDEGEPGGTADPTNPPSMFEGDAVGLVNLWRVSGAEGEADETWLRLDAGEFQLWRDCGMITGSWAARDGLMLAEVWGGIGDCIHGSIPSIPWLESIAGFAGDADGFDLLDAGGAVVATLTVDGAPDPIESAVESYTQAPTVSEATRALLSSPAPTLPDGFEAPGVSELEGRWSPVERTGNTEPFVSFGADGVWIGSDGCNGAQGRWALNVGGAFLSTAGPMTLIGCDGAPIQSLVSSAAAVGVDAEGALWLFDAEGAELGSFVR